MKTKIILITIFLIAFFIRIYNIQYPPLLWDEASLGYNAYSILKTGQDEYGKSFPLILKSFGDYKPGVYAYLTIPFISIFGLNELSVRLPSIILGSLIPIFLYLLIIAFDKKKTKLALIVALVTVFNPYNIHYSKGAWETNILTFQLLLASYFFIKKKYLPSALIFGLSLYTYQGAKTASLIVLLILLFLQYKNPLNLFKKDFKTLTLRFFIPLFILTIPLLIGLLTSNDSNRLKVLSIFSYPRQTQETNIFQNDFTFYIQNISHRYFNHFSPEFLFTKGDWQNPRHSAPYTGVLLLPSVIFLVIGLFKSSYKKRVNLFFLLILLFAPLSASFTRDSVQATRSMWMSLGLVYFIGFGINIFLKKFSNLLIYSLLIVIYLLSFIYYSDLYHNHMVKTNSADWLSGYKESITYLNTKKSQYENLIVTDFYGQPYIFYLFYSQYPPLDYQKQANLISDSVDTGKIIQIDNIEFKSPDFNQINKQKDTLAIFSFDEVIRQNLDFNLFKKFGNFYIYEN
jgi:4-amino-4-deoxy-L-arabinose transferase-like glycosyltransferase